MKFHTTPANDNNVTLSIKTLLCDACGENEALTDGYCGDCIADANAIIDERREEWDGERF